MGHQEVGSIISMPGNLYLQRYAYSRELISAPPHPDLSLVVVIPCYNEPDLLTSLQSLYDCNPPSGAVEVIVIINHSENSSSEVVEQNQSTFESASRWTIDHNEVQKQFHILIVDPLPPKHAGVGLARKIGMDEAIRRFEQLNRHDQGIIVCYDADCTCAPNYLRQIEVDFTNQQQATAATIYFEHPLRGALPQEIYEGITNYELFLRYYRKALQYIGYPYPYYTVGSCLAIKARAYQKQGGMNRRQAGEDFYFIEEHCRMGQIMEITGTTVYPSPRISNRVPFGTGKRQSQWITSKTKDFLTYHPKSFKLLRSFLVGIDSYFEMSDSKLDQFFKTLPSLLKSHLYAINAINQISRCREQTKRLQSFRKCFFQWFDGLRVLQFLNHARAKYKDVSIGQAATQMLNASHDLELGNLPIDEQLKIYRKLDKGLNQIQ